LSNETVGVKLNDGAGSPETVTAVSGVYAEVEGIDGERAVIIDGDGPKNCSIGGIQFGNGVIAHVDGDIADAAGDSIRGSQKRSESNGKNTQVNVRES
jgi:hypothetical protein